MTTAESALTAAESALVRGALHPQIILACMYATVQVENDSKPAERYSQPAHPSPPPAESAHRRRHRRRRVNTSIVVIIITHSAGSANSAGAVHSAGSAPDTANVYMHMLIYTYMRCHNNDQTRANANVYGHSHPHQRLNQPPPCIPANPPMLMHMHICSCPRYIPMRM